MADALVTIQKIREEVAENEVRTEAAREYLRLTDLRYRGGVVSYLEVLDAQRQLFAAETDLADTKRHATPRGRPALSRARRRLVQRRAEQVGGAARDGDAVSGRDAWSRP